MLQRRDVLDAQPWLRVAMETVLLPDGTVVEDFAAVELPSYINVAAITEGGQAVVTHGYKHGVGRACFHLTGGYIAAGEEPLGAAQRELFEETGYASDEWQALGAFTVDGNRGCGTGHLYLARAARLVTVPDSGDLEEAEVRLLTLEELWQATVGGEIGVMPNAAAIGLALTSLLMEKRHAPPPVSPPPAEPTPETPPEPPPPTETFRVVVEGETLWEIAERYGVTTDEIANLNQLESPDQILIGQELRIPAPPAE